MPFAFNEDCLNYVNGRNNFAFDQWNSRWAQATLFRISGLSDALQPLNLTRKDIEPMKSRYPAVAKKIPEGWKNFVRDEAAWGILGRPQIEGLAGRKHQTFCRALHSLVYVVDYLEEVRRLTLPADFLDPITIMPVIFHLTFPQNFDVEEAWDDRIANTPLEQAIRAAIAPSDPSVVHEAIVFGRRTTFHTGQAILNLLQGAGIPAELVCSASKAPGPVNGEYLATARDVECPAVVPNYIRGA